MNQFNENPIAYLKLKLKTSFSEAKGLDLGTKLLLRFEVRGCKDYFRIEEGSLVSRWIQMKNRELNRRC